MSNFSYQPPFPDETEKEIYQKWWLKCQAEANEKRKSTEENIYTKIQSDRELLNSLGRYQNPKTPIENPQILKLCTPEYMMNMNSNTNNIQNMQSNLPSSPSNNRLRNSAPNLSQYENKYGLYTLDGYPRRNFQQFYQNNNEINNGYGLRREATDVTNAEVYDKVNNPTYDEYKEKQKDFLKFNLHTIDDNAKYKDYWLNEKRKTNDERWKEMKRLRNLEYQEKLYENEKKKVYKDLLDDQLKVKVPSKLGQEYYSDMLNDHAVKFSNPNLYVTTPENSFMNRNKLVEINPYSLKNGELGGTYLNHNPITNPVFDYKYNKYLFPQRQSPFQRAGQYAFTK